MCIYIEDRSLLGRESCLYKDKFFVVLFRLVKNWN